MNLYSICAEIISKGKKRTDVLSKIRYQHCRNIHAVHFVAPGAALLSQLLSAIRIGKKCPYTPGRYETIKTPFTLPFAVNFGKET